jgi:hypothetical protein
LDLGNRSGNICPEFGEVVRGIARVPKATVFSEGSPPELRGVTVDSGKREQAGGYAAGDPK